ncbi:cysteine--tRNA ligase [Aeoliella sp. ICT_H6.2]|uniref:Cysteine--tRNA ligase n=1 Tax=Aeoliella straminimaris TaxID=2954799 RepID=A0A9X2FCZ9_9BACT|nr:cysteine--tRNA ligase [Aeoliella straminimaris]MCO6046802.1 cysteine--tRNA ligase [Aeoliella straminimaris]
MSTATQAMTAASTAAHPSLQIYNTLTKKKTPFEPVLPGKVGIYLCGPTVYAEAHIGHMVGPVIFDCIKRYLVYCGYDVTWVVNITDVDDKLIHKANERGLTMLEVAEENIADYNKNLAALGVDQIDQFPRATECMGDIIEFIESLVDQGYAYASEGDVYFDVGKDGEYGKLSNRSLDAMQGEGGGTADRKKNTADFALWKSAKPDEPSWDSPWGKGRPGWHIECSAMSKKILGETFDIHGGGLDLVFPHHENEIAQSECCHHKPMVKYWAHNGLLRKDNSAGKIGGKMSRSAGAGGLHELIDRQGGERIRFFLLRTHYRSTVLFSEPAIEEAAKGLESFYRLFKRYKRITGAEFYSLTAPTKRGAPSIDQGNDPTLTAAAEAKKKFLASMDDDFNTGGAIAELFELASLTNKYCDEADLEGKGAGDAASNAVLDLLMETIKELSNTLGLFLQPPAAAGGSDELLGQVMQLVIDLRADARQAKNFATADAIRDGLAPTGIVLEDRAGGTEWSGGNDGSLDGVMMMLIELRQTSRANKDFATGDAIRDRLKDLGVVLEDRAGGTEWTRG